MKNMKLILAALALLLPTTVLRAQTADRNLHSRVQVTFFTPLGTNGRLSPQYTNDLSLNLLAGVSLDERVFALGGLANVVRNEARGMQLAGLANYVGNNARGIQWAGVTNIVGWDFRGLQVAGLFNDSGDVHGLQLAGLVNMAANVTGVQVAGLVNIADHSDYPVGLVNIIRDGEMAVGVGYNDLGTASVTFRSGGRVLYGIIGAGYNHRIENSDDAVSFTGGFGAHIHINRWLRLDNEITTEGFSNFSTEEETDTFCAAYSLLPAFRIGGCVELFGGPNVGYMQTKDRSIYDIFPKNSFWEKESRGKLRQVGIGWQAGVQFVF